MADNTFARAAMLEKELAAAIDAAKKEIQDAVSGAQIPGVTRLSGCAFTVRSSMLARSWSPDYFDADGQKHRIHEKLSRASTLSGFRSALQSLLDDRKQPLHPAVAGILKDALDDIRAVP